MQRIIPRIGLIALMVSLDSLGFSSGPPPSEIRLYFTANREGEVEPCGCQVDQFGGLNRQDQFFDTEKRGNRASLYVDSGDSFFALNPPNLSRKEEDLFRAQLIARALGRWNLSTLVPGWRDFAQGEKIFRELMDTTDATAIAANLRKGGKAVFPATQEVDVRGVKILLIGVVSPEEYRDPFKVSDPVAAVRAQLASKKADLTIVLSRLGLEEDLKLARAIGTLDIIVGSRSLDVLTKPEKVGQTWIVQPHNQGQQVGVLDWNLKDPKKSRHSLVNLDRDLEGMNPVKKWMEAYREQVREIQLKKSGKAQETTSETPYRAHPMECRLCHQKQHDFWEGTKHASAYLVLYAKNQHFDPECISCHSVGYLESGGFQDIVRPIRLTQSQQSGKTPFVEIIMKEVFSKDPGKGALDSRLQPERYQALKERYHKAVHKLEEENLVKNIYVGVQCEHCHGNRHGHPGVPDTVKKVSETSCMKCHAPPHARPYESTMFSKVACPLSSQ